METRIIPDGSLSFTATSGDTVRERLKIYVAKHDLKAVSWNVRRSIMFMPSLLGRDIIEKHRLSTTIPSLRSTSKDDHSMSRTDIDGPPTHCPMVTGLVTANGNSSWLLQNSATRFGESEHSKSSETELSFWNRIGSDNRLICTCD